MPFSAGVRLRLVRSALMAAAALWGPVLDGAEDGGGVPRWVIATRGDAESAGLTFTENGAAELDYRAGAADTGKGIVLNSPRLEWNADQARSIRLDVTAERKILVALAVRADEYYESMPRELHAGRQTIWFDIRDEPFKSRRTSWRFGDRLRPGTRVRSLGLVLYPLPGTSGHFVIHAVGTAETGRPASAGTPVFLGVRAPKEATCNQKYEIATAIAAIYTNPFDPQEVNIEAEFSGPSGRVIRAAGFLYAAGRRIGGMDDWRVRMRPDVPGRWRYFLRVETPAGCATSAVMTFECRTGMAGKEMPAVRISREAPQYFELDNEAFFYPIGHNVAWNSLADYQRQFALMSRNGENWARIWIAPWNYEIEWSPRGGRGFRGMGWYNLENARTLDRIITAAETNGIYLQVVLHEHCRLSARVNPKWDENPYNRAAGGFLERPDQFFTDPRARRLARNRLRYIVARWGYSSAVMAWELFNEINLTDGYDPEHDTSWHREMADFLAQQDPYQRPITTSYALTPNWATFSLPQISFAQLHVYSPNAADIFLSVYPRMAQLSKPYFIGEFGRDPHDGVDAADRKGRTLHAGIWSQFMVPAAGNAMSWWWYDCIDPNRLYGQFAALSAFAEGLDRRGESWVHGSGCLHGGGASTVRCAWLGSRRGVMLWVYDPLFFGWSGSVPPTGAPRRIRGQVEVAGLQDGNWRIEEWDTWNGRCTNTGEATVTDGVLVVSVDFTAPDRAYRLKSVAAGEAGQAEAGAGGPQVHLDSCRPIHAGKEYPPLVVPAAGDVVVDGDLGEWGQVWQGTVSPTGGADNADCSAEFGIAHTGDVLLVAVRVYDDCLVRRHAGEGIWRDDCVELWIDSFHDASAFNNMPFNPGCYQINIAPVPSSPGRAEVHVFRNPLVDARLMKSIRAATRVVPDGYTVEAAIPLRILRGGGRAAGNEIGFNISVCDADTEGAEVQWEHFLWRGQREDDALQWSKAILRTVPQSPSKGGSSHE